MYSVNVKLLLDFWEKINNFFLKIYFFLKIIKFILFKLKFNILIIFLIMLTLSVSFGKNRKPFIFVTISSDNGGGFLQFNSIQGVLNGKEKKKSCA